MISTLYEGVANRKQQNSAKRRRDRGSPALGVMPPFAILRILKVTEAQVTAFFVGDATEPKQGELAA